MSGKDFMRVPDMLESLGTFLAPRLAEYFEAMKRLAEFANEEMILRAVEEWVDLLVEKRFQDALDFLHPRNYMGFTAESLENWISNYGSHEPREDGRVMEVTPRHAATGKRYNCDYDRCYPDAGEGAGVVLDAVGYVDYDLPLNGEWSDLTAQFFVCKYEHVLVLDLVGLRVM